MKILALDDLTIGKAVTVVHGPYETVIMPPMMLNGEAPPRVDTAVPGRVFTIEALDMNSGVIMLKAVDGGGPPEPKLQQAGPLMALLSGPSKPDTYMFRLDSVALAPVSADWLRAYMKNFCSHKGAVSGLRTRVARPSSDGKVAIAEGRQDDGGSFK